MYMLTNRNIYWYGCLWIPDYSFHYSPEYNYTTVWYVDVTNIGKFYDWWTRNATARPLTIP